MPSRGFTLLELCVVVAIGIVTASMAIPIFKSTLAVAKIRSAASSASGAIQTARYKALSKGVPYQIVFSKSAGAYTVLACSNCAATIYTPSSTFTYAADSSDPLTGVALPFSSGSSGVALDANRVMYFMPSGAVQWCTSDTTKTCTTPVTSCAPALQMILSNQGLSKTLTVTCYGQVTVQ
jgi:Tfp pilus assembly protein FimT